ncbi:MAG: SBBP repeat-containing protein, partial [Terriglobia bacterium]
LVYYGNQGQLEYDFVVAPGAGPGAIRLGFGVRQLAAALSERSLLRGQASGSKPPEQAPANESGSKLPHSRALHARAPMLRIAANGDLVMRLNGEEIRFHKPVVYQPAVAPVSPPAAGAEDSAVTDVGASLVPAHKGRPQAAPLRRYLDGRYVLKAHSQVCFAVASYDRSQPLIIDPVLTYSSYIGGSANDEGNAIAVDRSGNAYVMGITYSTDFPRVNQIPGACNGTCGSGDDLGDAFVTKINAAGTALVYSSYIGGSSYDEGFAIALDGSGNAYLAGGTSSSDFPRVNQIPGACNGSCGRGYPVENVFIAKINVAGSALVYSSLIGGSYGDYGSGITLDGSGNAYLTGGTKSSDFPRVNQIPGACNGTCGSGSISAVFVTKINAASSALVYSSLLGGSGGTDGFGDYGDGIAVDGSGNAYLTGYTNSTDFPRVNQIPGVCNGTCGSGYPGNAFVTKINAAGSALVYSSVIGGSGLDFGNGIALDGSDNVYLTGESDSNDFPIVGQIPGACNGSCGEANFVTKINAPGSALAYSNLIGGGGTDGLGIAVDGSGDAYLTGDTPSADYPRVNQIPGACNGTCGSGGYSDAFVTEINAAGSALVYSSYLGGSSEDFGYGIALDSSRNVYLTGWTLSTDFPIVNQIPGACNGSCGGYNTFVTKISPAGTPIVSLSPTSLTFGPQGVQAPNVPQTVTLTNTGQLPLSITSIAVTGQNSGDFLEADNCPRSPNTLAPSDSCRITVVFAPTGAGTLKADVTLTDNAPGSPQNVSLTGMGISGKPGLAGPRGAKRLSQAGRY